MERNGFNIPSFETSGDEPDDSKEKSKYKKKKSAEAVPVESAEKAKKETVADRGKSLWEKLVGDDKDKEQPHSPDTTKESENVTSETGTEIGDETDPGLEEMTPEEDTEVTRTLVEGKLVELEAERSESEAPEELVGIEAAIAMLEEMRAETAETPEAADENLETGGHEPHAESVAVELFEDEPAAFDDEQTIPIAKRQGVPPGSGSGGTVPPSRSGRPVPSSSQPPAFGGSSAGVMPEHTPVAVPGNSEYKPDYRENPNATYLLVGGVVGYLIGRRRGRIKTEKRLAVVQRKLEKQVEAKQQEINVKTEQVKKLARQNYEQSKSTSPLSEQRNTEIANTSVRQQAFESTPGTSPSLTRPTPESAAAETNKARNNEQIEARIEKGVELKDEDVERLSETITIGATNLRKIHEAKLITDGGLRRLVNEHLQGKDIRRGLAREFLTKELSYERDPRFRDIVPLEAKGKRSPAGGSASEPMLPVDEPVALATPVPTPVDSQPDVPVSSKPRRSAVSTGLLSTLSLLALALAIYAVWLGLSR